MYDGCLKYVFSIRLTRIIFFVVVLLQTAKTFFQPLIGGSINKRTLIRPVITKFKLLQYHKPLKVYSGEDLEALEHQYLSAVHYSKLNEPSSSQETLEAVAKLTNSSFIKSTTDIDNLPVRKLHDRTVNCLDVRILFEALSANANTILGKSMINITSYGNASEVIHGYKMINQISRIIDEIPIRSSMDIWTSLKALKEGCELNMAQLANFAIEIENLIRLQSFMNLHKQDLLCYKSLISRLVLPSSLTQLFSQAFHATAQSIHLNLDKYPKLQVIHKQIISIHQNAISKLSSIAKDTTIHDKLEST
jgi:hypothetical protein